MSLSPLFLVPIPLLLAASAPVLSETQPLGQAVMEARAQEAAADAETARLEKAAADARSEVDRLRARQAAAAQGIEAAEARITAADMQFRLASAYVEAHRARLAEEQQPISALLAGLAVMAERPPLLALADRGGTDDLVRIEVLLDSTLPVIRARTQALSMQVTEGRRLEAAAITARSDLVRSRQQLSAKRRDFAELEKRSIEQSLVEAGKALSSGDVAIAAQERAERFEGEEPSARSARQLAELLASEPPAPPRPYAPDGAAQHLPFAYVLPVKAVAIEGLGAVNDSGVRSRGISFATVRGAPVSAPADGIVRFSGPFRDYDGILILDHGSGWMSLIVGVSSPLRPGDRVALGDPLGRALGPVEVELSHNGQRFSPALIAGSSRTLSKGMKGS